MNEALGKRAALERAEGLLADPTPACLRYAALEMRFCLEAVAYEKLKVYAARIPPSLWKRWQPPQLFRALEQLEPRSTHSKRVVIRTEQADGSVGPVVFVGDHKSLSQAEMGKLYNKLGSYLHEPMPQPSGRTRAADIDSSELTRVMDQLRDVVASHFDGSLANVWSFDCEVCGFAVVANREGAAQRGAVECLNPVCGALYHVRAESEGSPAFLLEATDFECLSCGMATRIENRRLEIGLEFRCAGCGELHQFVQKEWGYVRKCDLK